MSDELINNIGLAIISIGFLAIIIYGIWLRWVKNIYNERKNK